ncbi:MAG: class I SAM-dependent methyltransferase [Acidobacteria bacterium]|nr:class I SAM-dependent methyltransferase [Acidobacteriota bacterium]
METTHHPFLEEVLPLMNVQPGDRIMDVGCGDGWACRRLAAALPLGFVIGLEISDDRVREARAKSTSFENILYLWSSAEQIPWQEDFFTKALCVDSVCYFGDLEKVLRELHRVLAPGGSLWIINPMRKEDGGSERILEESIAKGRLLSAEESVALLRECGFVEVVCGLLPNALENPLAPPDVSRSPVDALLISARKPEK